MARYCLFAGAGFSKWSCDLPLVSGLFDFAIDAYNERESKRLARLRTTFEDWQVANAEAHVEQFIALAQERPRLRALVNWYVTRRLTDTFVAVTGMRHTFYINSYHASGHAGVMRARRFVNGLRNWASLRIVTTNYDLIPEYALSSRGINYGVIGEQIGLTPYPYIQPVFALGNTTVAKLHGSVSWSELGQKTTDSRFGLSGKGLIIPPVSEKVPPPLLQQQWELARKILGETDKLIVFGFSFNENDLAVRSLVRESLRPEAEIVFIDAVDHRPRLAFLTAGRQTSFVSSLEKEEDELLAAAIGNDLRVGGQQLELHV